MNVKENSLFTGVDIAGPGFINLRLAPAFWQHHLAEILLAGLHYGDRINDVEAFQLVTSLLAMFTACPQQAARR